MRKHTPKFYIFTFYLVFVVALALFVIWLYSLVADWLVDDVLHLPFSGTPRLLAKAGVTFLITLIMTTIGTLARNERDRD